jgi:N-acetylglucosaminyldiphosphoundecaprenol N-acetyl-beta-D-mannosaminyltransferase
MTTCTERYAGERETAAARPSAVPRPSGEIRAIDDRVELFGIPIDRVTLHSALERIERWVLQGPCGRARIVVTPDTTALMRARRDPRLREVYRRADLVTADGAGIVWASRRLAAPLPERVAGIDLIEAYCGRAAGRDDRLFLLGAAPGVADAAARRLRRRFPGLNVVGTHHGYFSSNEESYVVREIERARPDVLLVGLGVPKQELWMFRNHTRARVPVMIGVGGSFDVLSGRLPRAPRLWQRIGLEWLWRALREPRRLWRVRVIPLFMLQILTERALYGLEGSSTSTSSSWTFGRRFQSSRSSLKTRSIRPTRSITLL